MAVGGRELKVYLTSDTSRFQKGLGKAETGLHRLKRVGVGVMQGIGVAALAAGAAAAEAIQEAAADLDSQKKLAAAMKTVTGATDDQVAAMEDYITAAQKRTGMDDGKMRRGLGNLLRITKDATRAQQLNNTAMEIVAATGLDYESVVRALGKAQDGQTSALRRLGIALGPAAQNAQDLYTAQKDFAKAQDEANLALEKYGPKSKEYAAAVRRVARAGDKVAAIKGGGIKWLQELNKTFEGSVAADADTYSGSLARLGTAWDEFREAFGTGALGDDGPPQQINELTDALYDAQPAAETAGGAIITMMGNIVRALPDFLLGIEGLKVGVGNFIDEIGKVAGTVIDTVGPPGLDSGGKAAQDAQARIDARNQGLYDYWQMLNPTPVNNYAQYRPMSTDAARYGTRAANADTRARANGVKTRATP